MTSILRWIIVNHPGIAVVAFLCCVTFNVVWLAANGVRLPSLARHRRIWTPPRQSDLIAAYMWRTPGFLGPRISDLALNADSTALEMDDFVGKAPEEFQPDHLQLYLSLVGYSGYWPIWWHCVFPSLQLFWPDPHIVVAMDNNTVGKLNAPRIANSVAKIFPPLKAKGVLVVDHGLLMKSAKWYIPVALQANERQQLDMMYVDTVVTSKYVGLLDVDALFVTLVTPQAIFSQDGRPVVMAMFGEAILLVHKCIQLMLKKPSAISCMSSFPTVFATNHLAEMRTYVEKVNGQSFLQMFRECADKVSFCPYTTMCNFVWYFHRDEYDWHFMNFMHDRFGWKETRRWKRPELDFLTEKKREAVHPCFHSLLQRLV